MRKIGIEIENESRAVDIDTAMGILDGSSAWVVESDGSLRGGQYGWEIKTAGYGLPFNNCIASLNELYPVMQSSSGIWRAAVHVHVDTLDMSWLQRALALCVGYAYDDSIFDLTSPERRESNFCVPLRQKTEDVFYSVRQMLMGREADVGYGKYSSINSNSLNRFGTYEYRHMQTPAAGLTVASVRDALAKIANFARIAHDLVCTAKYCPSDVSDGSFNERRATLLTAFLSIIDAQDTLFSSLGLRASSLAVLDVLTFLGGDVDSFDRTQLDLPSIARCVPDGVRQSIRRHREVISSRPVRRTRVSVTDAELPEPEEWIFYNQDRLRSILTEHEEVMITVESMGGDE